MQIIDFLEATEIKTKTESEKAKLLCFYHYKETGNNVFTMALISELMVRSGFNAPNTSRLKDKLIKGKDKAFLKTKGKATTIEFVPAILQSLEKSTGCLWIDSTTIESSSELIDETKFCGYRGYLDRLKSNYAGINVDELHLDNYPDVKSLKDFKEKMMMVLYIITNEKVGEWFATSDVLYLMTDVFGEAATKDQVNGVFKRERLWFKAENIADNRKDIKRKLLNQGIAYAKNLIVAE